MSFNAIKVIIPISGIGVAGTAGVWYFYPREQATVKDKFKDVFRHAILNSSEDAIWTTKLSKLGSSNIHGINEKLSNAKSNASQTNGKQLLQEACSSIYESEFSGKNSDDYKNFKDFCSRSNKDKLPADQFIGTDDTSLANQSKAIFESKGPFSDSFKTAVKDKITNANAEKPHKDSVKEWCANHEGEPYMRDLISTEFETYCKKKS